jgi:hypothetical protein
MLNMRIGPGGILSRPEALGTEVAKANLGLSPQESAEMSQVLAASVERRRNRTPEAMKLFFGQVAAFGSRYENEGQARAALVAGKFAEFLQQAPESLGALDAGPHNQA